MRNRSLKVTEVTTTTYLGRPISATRGKEEAIASYGVENELVAILLGSVGTKLKVKAWIRPTALEWF